MPEEEKQEQKEDDKVILTTDMHCNECQRKVNKILKSFPGVEKVDLDAKERKVTVKGKVDAKKVFEAVKQKCGKRTVLVYPQLPKEDDKKKEENEKPKEEPPPDVTVELKVKMHCGACAKEIRKKLLKMNGVMEVHENVASDKVVVKGKGLDAEKLCERVRKSGRHCQVIPPPSPPPQKEEKKEEEKKVETKETKEAEEKKEEKKEEKQEEGGGEVKVEVKKYVYPPYRSVHDYMYAPQLFSDENPNACNIM